MLHIDFFTTNERSFIVADCPGHEQYTRNMAVGASFADLAIILVDASKRCTGADQTSCQNMRIDGNKALRACCK